MNRSLFSFQASVDRGYPLVLPRQSTESEKTCTFAFDSLTALPCNKVGSHEWNIDQKCDFFEVRVLGCT